MTYEKFMQIALDEAKNAYNNGQIPIGATLVIDGKIIDTNSNNQIEQKNTFNHAENILIQRNSSKIREARFAGKQIELYSTVEPCIMCFGAAVHNRIKKIVYACPDPCAGSTNIKSPTEWYSTIWPERIKGPFAKESCELMIKFMEENSSNWKETLELFKKLRQEIL